jgi:hypothetical protein
MALLLLKTKETLMPWKIFVLTLAAGWASLTLAAFCPLRARARARQLRDEEE